MASTTCDMTSGKPAPTLIRFAVPILLGSMIDMVYVTADGIVLGRLIGVNAFAAVGAAAFLYWTVSCIQAGLTAAFRSVFAHRFGAKDPLGLSLAVAMSIWVVVVFGGALSAGGILAAEPLLRLLDTPLEIASDARIYLQVRFASMPIAFLGGTAGAVFYAVGNSRVPFVANAISVCMNIALNFLLVLATPLGVAGVALATAIAQLFSLVFCVAYLRKAAILKIGRRELRPDRDTLKELLAIGLPLGIRDLPAAIVALVVLRTINAFGTAYTAGIAAAKQLNIILFPVGEAFQTAIVTFVGQNFGAKKFSRISLGFRSAVKIMLLCAAVIIVVITPLRRMAISLFIAGDGGVVAEALEIGVRQLNVILLFLPAYYLVLAYRGGFNGLGNGIWPLVSGFLEAGARLVVILTLPVVIGEWGLYLAETIGWPVMAIQLMTAYRLDKKLMPEPAQPSVSREDPHGS